MVFGSNFPSLFTILCVVFIGYVSLSVWNLIKLFQAPHCDNPRDCFLPLVMEKPQYQLLAYTSVKKKVHGLQDLTFLYQQNPFDYNVEQTMTINLTLPKKVQENGTMDLHLFISSPKLRPKDLKQVVANELTVYSSISLTQYEVPEVQVFQLLGDTGQLDSTKTAKSKHEYSDSSEVPRPVTHLRSRVEFHILTQDVSLPKDKIDYEVSRFLKVNSKGKYLPMLRIDHLTLRIKELVKVDPLTSETNLTLVYSPMSFGKLRLGIQVEAALDQMKRLGFTTKDVDEVKGLFSGVNLYLLCGTFIISALHLMFDFLAFKNEISFWRGLDHMGGISPSTVAWRAFAQVVIFFYLMEEKTSILVLAPSAVGAIIELWKVTKAFHIRFDKWQLVFGKKLTKEESDTQALDSEGFKYLTYLIYPLCFAGAVYSLLYTPHKSWYSWVIQCLVNGVYAFGFLFMMPQLFINYKLKSVAHLPWRAFMYKAFNTFIDDIFAFVITMPTAHRVACFRDDIVFVIYLYQKWLYPVDKTRVNEYGQKGEDKPKKD